MSTTTKAGRRERLLARSRPSATYQLAVVDDGPALDELSAAREALDRAELRLDDAAPGAVAEAETRLAAARDALAACYEPVTLTAMEPRAFEALVAEHPAPDGKEGRWNEETFPRAVFLATVDTSDLAADEWAAFVDDCLSQGEQTALYAVAVGINARWPSGAIPKD